MRRSGPLAAVMLTASLLSFVRPAVAQSIPISVSNASFEQPGAETLFWDGSGAIVPGAIPGWEVSGPGVYGGVGDSGVEGPGHPPGSWAAYLNTQDPTMYQTTSHSILAGSSYSASFWLFDAYTDGGVGAAMTVSLYYFDGANRVTLGTPQTFNPAAFAQYSLSLTAAEAAPGVGNPIGIEFDTTTITTNDSWLEIDDVALSYTAIPEPATGALAVAAGIAASTFARRRFRQG